MAVVRITPTGDVGIKTNTPTQALDVAGNIAVTGTVDGRDVSADGSKLDGIAAGATVGMRYVGTGASPITDAATARPSTAGPVYWLCANGVTPTNSQPGDIIWNADA